MINCKVRVFKYSSGMKGRILELFNLIEGNGNANANGDNSHGNGNGNGVMEKMTEMTMAAMVNQRRKPASLQRQLLSFIEQLLPIPVQLLSTRSLGAPECSNF